MISWLSAGGQAQFVHIDVPRSRGVQTMVKVYVDTHGGDQMLDVNLKFVNVWVMYKIRATFAAIYNSLYGFWLNAICPSSIDTPMRGNARASRDNDLQNVTNGLPHPGRFG